jgi:glycosyltransferase involved in cell wall biosynthesis
LVLEALAATSKGVRERLHFSHIGGVDGTAASSGYYTFLQARTRELGLEANVAWLGEQASSRPFLGEIDCLVIASEREPFSIAMLEALAAGLPVLAADSGGARDVILPSQNGWLFRSWDVNDLAAILARLSNEGISLRTEGQSSTVRRFVASSVASQWVDAYSAVLGLE